MDKKFEFLKHTADIKFRAYGKTLNGVFENCTLAISSIFSRDGKIKSFGVKNFTVKGKDYESLLYNFIEELIYLFDAEGFVVSKTKVRIKDIEADVTVYGDETSKYSNLDSIKSPTYAEMYIKKKNNLWEAQVVVDV